MKRIVIYPSIIIFAITLILLVWLQKAVPNIILSKFYNEDVLFSSFKSLWSIVYIAGCFLFSTYLAWKYASIMDKKVKGYVVSYRFKIKRIYLLIASIIFLILPFNHVVVFSATGIHDFNIFSQDKKNSIKYTDITSTYVQAHFDQVGGRGEDMCQARTYFYFTNGNQKIESWIRMPYVYDIGDIFKQNNTNVQLSYINACEDNDQFTKEKFNIENALGASFE